ncbi:hypothetical protein DACRYDRAFT_15170 [Dacryopinax primogenitus]|uniref:Uncharacterized protein n=1 Tax=Dacryopinax primogenitus (strain DJM 731) TaxID=1858805 RepID=M5GEK2_DACPD|nr:uncharacterized protein DACRYDRAFT_15170 [Dacryopinax primogenitus]EJU03333.1 hypothetical protein DACRYDRAFT_15170 [Dacryopinax primogenitus]
MDRKGKGKSKAGYKPLPTDGPVSSEPDMELTTLTGPPPAQGTARFPTRYLMDDYRLDDERKNEREEDQHGVPYHEKQWPMHRRVWRKRWCEWRVMLLVFLATLVFGTMVWAISAAPGPRGPDSPTGDTVIAFGSDLGCTAPHFFNDPRNANLTIGNTTWIHIGIPPSGEFTLTTLGWIATGTISITWDRSLPSDLASLGISLASQDPGFFDWTIQYGSEFPGLYLEVYDEANDMRNCVVYNLTLGLPWEISTLTLDLRSRAQVRVTPPANVGVDDGSAALPAHTLEELHAQFSSNRTGSLLLLSEGLRTERASIDMAIGEITGSWPKPKALNLSLGEGVTIGAGFELFPFDG